MANRENDDLRDRLREFVETVDIAEALTTPIGESIENLLRVSASAVNSEGASVLLREGAEGDLRFAWATGSVAGSLIDMTVPSGKGIAGFVFSSGQPMAISDVEQETSFYAEVDRTTGFSTQTILATPLQFDGETIGVLEYVNRIGGEPYEPFTAEEMDIAALYSESIGSLVHAYEAANIFGGLSEKMVGRGSDGDFSVIRSWISALRETKGHREMMDLAVLVREVASSGDAEKRLCREVLESILRFSGDTSEIDLS